MPGGKHVQGGRSRRGWLVALALMCLVAAVLYWSLDTLLSEADLSAEGDGDPSPSASAEPGGSSASPDSGTNAAVGRCASDLSQAEKTLAAAKPGVKHWHAHVRARTDALAGRISDQRMNRIFDRTRLGGPEDQERYLSAREAFSGQVRCDLTAEAPDAPKAVTDCIARAAAVTDAVAAADQAMLDWRRHLKKMAAFRNGGMSAHRAQHLWVVAWRTAPVNIVAYQRAAADVAEAPPCGETSE